MNQRLVWNFECSTIKKSLPFTSHPPFEKDDLKWESRYFWPDDQMITVFNIDNSLLDLANYEQKHKNDYYYLLPDFNYNIKRRRNELLYKPIKQHTIHALGFGAKINLEGVHPENPDAAQLHDILRQTHEKGKIIQVQKDAYVFKFSSSPIIKLELARLEVHNRYYFSACIEGRSLYLVETISEHLLGKQVSCDYVTFLKNTLNT